MVYSPVNPWTFPVNPSYPWIQPSTIISSITRANPTVITTTSSHGYASGLVVRVVFPSPYSLSFGMTQINGLSGPILVLSPTTFSIPIDTTTFSPFLSETSGITNITQATKAVVTVTTNNFVVGTLVTITGVGGMTEINGGTYIIEAISGTSITIGVDSTLFSPYGSGGTMAGVEQAQIIPLGLLANAPDVDAFTQVNPVNPQTLAQVPLFQKKGLQAGGPVNSP